jgi:beta-glucosidase
VVDRNRQEDSYNFKWAGNGEASVYLNGSSSLDLSRETNGAVNVELDFKIAEAGAGPVTLYAANSGASKGIDITTPIKAAAGKGWQSLSVPLSCFAKAGLDVGKLSVPFGISTSAKLDMTVSRLALGTSNAGKVECN